MPRKTKDPTAKLFDAVRKATTVLTEAIDAVADAVLEPADDKGGKKKTGRKKKLKLDDVRDTMLKVIEEFSQEDAVDVIKTFDVKRVSELAEDQYADVIAALKKVLEDGPEETDDDDPDTTS